MRISRQPPGTQQLELLKVSPVFDERSHRRPRWPGRGVLDNVLTLCLQ